MRLNHFIIILTLLLAACSHTHNSQNKSSRGKNNAEFSSTNSLKKEIISSHLAINVDSAGQPAEQDLAAFAKKIENVRILALGEQTHGAGSVFKLKTDLIKYLHQHHGFDLFILESGMYDVREIYQQAKNGQSIKTLAPGNIFYMYAKSEEVTTLFDYVNEQINTENPLTMVGFDSQHTGGLSLSSLVTDLTKAQAKIDCSWVNSPQWQLFSQQVQQVLDGSNSRFAKDEETVFFSLLDKLASNFDSHNSLGNNGFWLRISKGLVAQAKRQWQLGDNRSEQMGENIKWWAEQYPDKKIIVWAHTWHLTKEGNNQINAGKVVSDAFGEAYYMVHFSGEQGKYLSYIDLKNKGVAKLTENSVEQTFNQAAIAPINFVENKGLLLKDRVMAAFANDYQTTLPANQWSTYWDGMFVLKEITPATYQQ
ncbi:erythromycin esterase family protein [Colwellia psychrerythraea]|uniref:Erythromycin esterase n=1 Tax=Colwellia psychrerythraea TaxID=28229 RepID=A0A099KHJ0_COLPS|nr:erythromycin esterase family protein [Colwellia psychrerythraea]KGJ89063.1 Erythromycin esterase [Colwellia psychrerythraea]